MSEESEIIRMSVAALVEAAQDRVEVVASHAPKRTRLLLEQASARLDDALTLLAPDDR